MPVEFKDYYKVLGVPKAATEEEIKKAFRRLAREFHPDVAKDKKGAEARFKEINEAYEVLGDPSKRQKYDQLGSEWRQGQGFQRRGGQSKTEAGEFEFEVGGTGFSDFFEQVFGARGTHSESTGNFYSQKEDVFVRGEDIEADIWVALEEVSSGSIRPISLRRFHPCEACKGTGMVRHRPCVACHARGQVERNETYQVKIPPGVGEGQRLRVPGQGEVGFGKGSAGDLYLRVRYSKHPDFFIEGGILHCELDVAPWEAVLGASVSVPTLQGPVSIRVPPGTQTGARLRVRGKGLPRHRAEPGDLLVVIRVVVPTQISSEQKRLWQQLEASSGFNPRE